MISSPAKRQIYHAERNSSWRPAQILLLGIFVTLTVTTKSYPQSRSWNGYLQSRFTDDYQILCTGNSCRSQMAEGFLNSFDSGLEVYYAGTKPGAQVHPKAIQVMKEIGVDISGGSPKNVDRFLEQSFDYVITVCDNARETCPVFMGDVKERLHFGFEDLAEATGSDAEVISEFRRIRDEIQNQFQQFHNNR